MSTSTTPISPRLARFAHAWRALRHRNFQLYFFGQGISLIGNWMTGLATAWLVYRLTHSALLLGVVSFAGQIVAFCLGPFAGVWVERLPRRRLLLCTQAAAAAQSLALAGLTLTHRITFPEIVALAVVQGLINSLDMPARQSFLVQTVASPAGPTSPEDLGNAIALNSTMVNGARLIGPALAGLLISAVGEGWCFLIDGCSYLAVIASLLLMRLAAPVAPRHRATMLEQMREGWSYLRGSVPLRSILSLFALVALMGYPYVVLLPVFAAQTLHGGPKTLAWLTGASAVGALVSALSLAFRRSPAGLPRMIAIASGTLGAALILFGLSRSFPLSLVALLFAGFGLMQTAAASNTVIQSLVPDTMRARIMSFYTMAFFGAAPLGSLLAGAIAQHLGAPATVLGTGVVCLGASLWFTRQLPRLRAAAAA